MTQKLLEIEAYEAMNKRRAMNIRGISTVLPSELVAFNGVALDPAPAFIDVYSQESQQHLSDSQDFQTLPSFARHCLCSHEIGSYGFPGHSQSYQLGDYGLVFRIPVLDPLIGSYCPIVRKDHIHQMKIDWASRGVYRSLVGLAIHHCGKVSEVFSGTVVHPDGIIATSANCLKPLEGTEFEISVKLLHSGGTYKGVLLEADFCSHIAFVKIIPGHRLTAATFGKLDSMRDNSVVAGGCILQYSSWDHATSDYNLGYLRLDAGGSIDQEMENTESRNERTSGQLIKAEVLNVARASLSLSLSLSLIGYIERVSSMVG
ncbi:uncharacterized protein LOC131324011 [Rhododendron vialii]|uniref:uncharacterized protein LOC131324011 n=1 Tax=Rhododendron vialii TaxID=182163 RepID=UPI00265FC1A8|nr:uncharacterized protein LOC131324011 [Rhododendron vialii]